MRSWILPAILGLSILVLIVGTPIFWQWSYQIRLLDTVAVGATKQDYMKALLSGDLGQGIPRPGFSFVRPLNSHGVVYTIFALPHWDAGGRLTGYRTCAELSWPGHSTWFSRPDSRPEIDSENF